MKKKARKRVYRMRVNDVECDILEKRAAAAGINATAYMRSCVFPTNKKPHPLWPQFLKWLENQIPDERNVATNHLHKGHENVATKAPFDDTKRAPLEKVATKTKKTKDKPVYITIKASESKIENIVDIDLKPLPAYRRQAEPGSLLKK